jgi:hypothetical protein
MTTDKTKTAVRTVEVDADALYQVLQALVGPGHHIRELQFTRSLHKLGHPNAIETLIEGYTAALAAPKPAAAPVPAMTLDQFFAEADRIGLTADTFAAQLAARPEFADCLPAREPDDTPLETGESDAVGSL